MQPDLEKQALFAKAYARLRHPLNTAKRVPLEEGIREWKFENINERMLRGMKKAKVPEALEGTAKFVFFPKKGKGLDIDPVRRFGSKAFGQKSTEFLADNPELAGVGVAASTFAPLIPAASLLYLGAKSALYKGLNIPTPSHMRHLKQKEKIKDIAKATAAGVGAAGAGVVGYAKLKSHQKKSKTKKRRVELQQLRREDIIHQIIGSERQRASSPKAKRAEMYKSAADEIQKIARSKS